MIVNLIVIMLILVIGQFYTKKSRLNFDNAVVRKKYISLICFILILQSGLRNIAVGDDTYAYFLTFEETKNTSWESIFDSIVEYYQFGLGKDPGYPLFLKTIQLVTGEFQIYLLIIALLFFVALGNFIYKNTTRLFDVKLAFVIYSVLFYSFYSITGIRQTIATAATLYGYELIKRKKLIPFLILIFLASTIHKSVLVFLPFYFLVQMKQAKYLYWVVLLLFPVFMIFKNNFGSYISVLGGYEQYDQYEGAGTLTFTLMFLFIAVIALWRRKIILKNNSNAQHYFTSFAVALLFIPLTWINPTMMRIVMYFSIFMLLFIPEIIYSFLSVSKKIKADISILAIVILISLFLKSNWNNDFTYGFFWEEMRLNKNYFIND